MKGGNRRYDGDWGCCYHSVVWAGGGCVDNCSVECRKTLQKQRKIDCKDGEESFGKFFSSKNF